MTEMVAKAALLQRIQAEYKQFETLLTPLSEEQMRARGAQQRRKEPPIREHVQIETHHYIIPLSPEQDSKSAKYV